MTDKLIMTTAQRVQLVQALRTPHGHAQAAIDMLQDLPVVDGEPAEWQMKSPFSLGRWVKISKEQCNLIEKSDAFTQEPRITHTRRLYTSPQALTALQGEPRHPQFVAGFKSGHTAGRLRGKAQALTPITADDVTDEMVDAYFSKVLATSYPKDFIAAGYNAVIKHRSEA